MKPPLKKGNRIMAKDDIQTQLQQGNPWGDGEGICQATSLCLYRNFAKFQFPGKLDTGQRQQLVNILENILLKAQALQSPSCYHAEDLSPQSKEFLYEYFLGSQAFQQAHAGEAFVLDASKNFLGLLNIHEHLQLNIVKTGLQIDQAWQPLATIESEIGSQLDYAFSANFGFLTSQARYCGTALKASIFLQIPALIATMGMEELIDLHTKTAGLRLEGIQGELDKPLIGSILILKNNWTLGISEEDILQELQSNATKLAMAEQSARKDLKAQPNIEIQDSVARSLGLLSHSKCLDTIESLNALSLLSLGVSTGWIQNLQQATLDQAFIGCHRAHLASHPSKANMELSAQRAQYLQKHLKGAKLTI